jgi:hypothetical protein
MPIAHHRQTRHHRARASGNNCCGFYHDWYRPDLMAVIVVGDVDRDAVATMIRQHFASLSAPSPERVRGPPSM